MMDIILWLSRRTWCRLFHSAARDHEIRGDWSWCRPFDEWCC